MIDKTIILVSGYKRAGKDFVSSFLKKELENSTTYSLAYPLKDIVATTFGISLEELDDFKNNKESIFDGDFNYIIDFRKILQIFGSEAMKKWFTPKVWTNLFLDQEFSEDYIIIPDWRFPTEIEEFSKVYKNIVTIRVNDDNIENTDMHVSETSLDDYPFRFVLNNTAKDESIIKGVKDIIKEIKG